MDWQTNITILLLVVAGVIAALAWRAGEGEDEDSRIASERNDKAHAIIRNDLDKLDRALKNLPMSQASYLDASSSPNQHASRVNSTSYGQRPPPAVQALAPIEQTRAAERPVEQFGRVQTQYATAGLAVNNAGYSLQAQDPLRTWQDEAAYQPARLANQLDPAARLPEAWSSAYRSDAGDMVEHYFKFAETQWTDKIQLGDLNIWALRMSGGRWYLMHKIGVRLDENFGTDFFEVGGSGSYVAAVGRPATLHSSTPPADLRSFRRDTLDDWRRKSAISMGSLTCSDNPRAW